MIGNCMIRSSKAFSEEDVDKFFSLSERFYGNDFLSDGYFIDCGANIGTTSIYVSKIKGKPVVSIECGEENYSLLEVNCLINNANNIICVKKALSDEKTELSYNYIDDNSGASFLSTKRESSEDRGYSQIVNTDTLENVLTDNNISFDEVGYLWIDTEGFDSKVILSIKKILVDRKIPLFQEFFPAAYKENGTYDEYIKLMQEVYDGFIDTEVDKEYKISQLNDYAKNVRTLANIFFY